MKRTLSRKVYRLLLLLGLMLSFSSSAFAWSAKIIDVKLLCGIGNDSVKDCWGQKVTGAKVYVERDGGDTYVLLIKDPWAPDARAVGEKCKYYDNKLVIQYGSGVTTEWAVTSANKVD